MWEIEVQCVQLIVLLFNNIIARVQLRKHLLENILPENKKLLKVVYIVNDTNDNYIVNECHCELHNQGPLYSVIL